MTQFDALAPSSVYSRVHSRQAKQSSGQAESPADNMFSLACTSQAANQVNWDNVGVSGLKQLCTYTAHVGGLNN